MSTLFLAVCYFGGKKPTLNNNGHGSRQVSELIRKRFAQELGDIRHGNATVCNLATSPLGLRVGTPTWDVRWSLEYSAVP